MDLDLEKVALRVDQRLPLAAGDLLAAIVAAGAASFRGLDGLAVDGARGRLRITPLGDAMAFTQDLVDPFPGAIPTPLAKVRIDIIPVRQVVRHHTPGNPATQNVETAIDDPAQIVLSLATTSSVTDK
jgi:hypothetical protein